MTHARMKIKAFSLTGLVTCLIGCFSSELAPVITFKTGAQTIYTYKSEGIGYSDISRLYSADNSQNSVPFFYRPSLQTTGVKIKCDIKKTIIASAGDSMQVCFEIVQPDVKIESGALPVDASRIMEEMTMPIFANMRIAGNILTIKTDTSVSFITAGIIKNILSSTQAVLLTGEEESWQVKEENTIGLFKADYKLVHKNDDSTEYQKTNSGYEKIAAVKKGQKYLPDSRSTIITDQSGAVQSIRISESLVTLFGADTLVASGSITEYKRISASSIDQQSLLAFGQLEQSGKYSKSSSLSAPLTTEEINRMAYRNTLGDDNFESLSAKLGQAKTAGAENESELVKKFRALAWLSETDCSKMAALLKLATPQSDTFRMMSHALAATETPYSINELAVIIGERRNEELVLTALLPVLAISSTPTAKAADIIQTIAFAKTGSASTRSTAQLTLGGMVKNLMMADRKKADELTDVIVENMKDTRDTIQKLLVYGNTGSYKILPVISSCIFNPSLSVEIRKAAVFATRLIDHKEVVSLLEKLSAGKDSVLSKSANETIEFRNNYLNRN